MNPKHLTKNPVSVAVARAKLRSALVDQKIKLYLLTKGEACDEFMEGLGLTLVTVGIACDLQKLDSPKTRVLRGGMSACQQLMLANSYDPMQTMAIDLALQAAEELNKQLAAESLIAAWARVTQGCQHGSKKHPVAKRAHGLAGAF